MADTRTMAQLLQAPTEGYEDAILIPEIVANNFKREGEGGACPHNGFSELHQLATFYNCFGTFLIKIHELRSSAKAVVAQGSGTLPGNTVTNPREDLKGITTRSGVAYQGPPIPTSSVVKPIPEVTKDQVHPSCSQISLPYPSRRDNEKSRNQANEQIDKFYEIFKEMSFEISFTDALVLMPKFASTLRTLLGNKEKLTEVARTSNEPCLARTSMNEHCSAVILNKLPRKLGDPGKFLIPCEFPGMDECLALADLGASINLMPFSVWEKLSLPDLTPTCMTLELADRSISKPMGIAKDISVKVGVFHFPADVVVMIRMSASNPFYNDPEGHSYSEAILNSEPPLPPPSQGTYLPEVRTELKVCETNTANSSIDEPTEVELKELPPHLEYAFLEGDNKLPVIIAKELDVEKNPPRKGAKDPQASSRLETF
ncbi:reverse transcriptase domain-containing protein [Tanacetum coccineum]